MTRTKPFAQIAAKAKADPARQVWMDGYRRAIDDSLALAELCNRVGVTQSEVAGILDVSQGNVSRIERGEDLYLSTLQRYVAALGGRLVVEAVFPGLRVNLLNGPPDTEDVAAPTVGSGRGAAKGVGG